MFRIETATEPPKNVGFEGVVYPVGYMDACYMGRVEGGPPDEDRRMVAQLNLGRVSMSLVEVRDQSMGYRLYSPLLKEPLVVTEEPRTIGRGDLQDAGTLDKYYYVSREHAQISLLRGPYGREAVAIRDCNSTNGTTLVVPEVGRGPEKPPEMELAQAEKIAYSKRDDPLHGDDRTLELPKFGVFGVFDGVGSDPNAAQAAQMTVDALKFAYGQYKPEDVRTKEPESTISWMIQHLNVISEKAYEKQLGSTTAMLAQIIHSPRGDFLAWAGAGDSRLYLKRDDRVYQLTTDDGEGHVITRHIGSAQPAIMRNHQVGFVPIGRGDLLFAVTDGCTGDFGSDRVTSQELEYRLRGCTDATKAAETVIGGARKKDDRSAVVVSVK